MIPSLPPSPIRASSESGTLYLTGIRGLAALLILVAHAANNLATWPVPNLAMSLFFVLSGFVLTLNYSRTLTGNRHAVGLYNFFVSRIARLCPLYFTFLFTLGHFAKFFPRNPSASLSYMMLTQSWVNNQYVTAPWTWSISTEIFSYLFLPLLLFLLAFTDTLTKLLLAYTGVVLVGVTVSYLFYAYGHSLVDHWPLLQSGSADNDEEWIRYYNPYLRLFDFWIGCVAAKLYLHEGAFADGWRGQARLATCGSGLLALMAYQSCHPGSSRFFDFLNHNFAAAPFIGGIMLISGRNPSWITRWFETRAMLFAGEISYSLYLLHQTVFERLPKWMSHVIPDFESRWAETTQPLQIATAILAAIIVSYASTRIIEVPARRWIRRYFMISRANV